MPVSIHSNLFLITVGGSYINENDIIFRTKRNSAGIRHQDDVIFRAQLSDNQNNDVIMTSIYPLCKKELLKHVENFEEESASIEIKTF